MIAINLKNRTFPRNLRKYAAQHKIIVKLIKRTKMKHIFTTFKQFMTKPLLLALTLLAMSSNAWGWSKTFYAKCKVVSQPATGGYVYVSNSGKTSVTYDKTTDESTNNVKKSGQQTLPAPIHYNVKTRIKGKSRLPF